MTSPASIIDQLAEEAARADWLLAHAAVERLEQGAPERSVASQQEASAFFHYISLAGQRLNLPPQDLYRATVSMTQVVTGHG